MQRKYRMLLWQVTLSVAVICTVLSLSVGAGAAAAPLRPKASSLYASVRLWASAGPREEGSSQGWIGDKLELLWRS